MTAHMFEIETDNPRDRLPSRTFRWRCSCGKVGPWKSGASGSGGGTAERRARNGGERHVAAMERGA